MGVVVRGKVKVVKPGMAGIRIAGKTITKVTDGNRKFCTILSPGKRLDRIINHLAARRR